MALGFVGLGFKFRVREGIVRVTNPVTASPMWKSALGE